MASEIRANTLKNRVGLGTIEYSNTGPVISGVTTSNNFKTGSTNVHSVGIEAAGINVLGADTPIGTGATIYNSGAAVFTGVVTATSFSGGTVKATNLTSDRVVFTTTNGQLEASGNLTYNGTTLASGSPVDINSDLDVDGHTNLDNVSITGVTTTTENIRIGANNKYLKLGASDQMSLVTLGGQSYITNSTGHLTGRSASYTWENFAGTTEYLRIGSNGRVGVNTDNPQSTLYSMNEIAAGDGNRRFIGMETKVVNGTAVGEIRTTYYSGANGNYPEMRFVTHDTERLRINSNGTVHTGMTGTAPSWLGGTIATREKFSIFQGANFGEACFNIDVDNANSFLSHNMYYSGGWKIRKSGQPVRHLEIGTNGWTFKTGADGSDDTGSALSQRFRIDQSGNVTANGNLTVQGSGGINISYSGADLTMNSAGGIFTGNGGNATNPIVANVSDTNTGIFYPGADKLAVTTGGTERIRIEDGLITLFDSTGAYHKPTLKIANQSHSRYGGSLVFTAENNSGTEYTTARLRAYGGGSDTGGQIGVGCGDFSGDGDKIRIFMDGKISISPTGNCTNYNNSLALTVVQTGGTNGYPGIHLKSLKSGGGEGMSFVATDDNWDLYTRSGNENGLGILRAGAAASGNARFYLTNSGHLTVGDHTYTDLATSKKGHTMMHVAGGGLSIGPKGNDGNSTQGGRYVLGWYMTGYSNSHSYLHLITDLWAGGSPHGNNEYIMGGFHIHGHQYSGGASVSRERIYFHNWGGSYPGYSNSNPGTWSPGSTVYTHSTGYMAIRLLTGSYRGYIIDLIQHAWYPTRDMNVTSATYSDSSTL